MHNIKDPQLGAQLQATLDELLIATDASRSTLRFDDLTREWHVDFAIVEALRPGVKSLLGIGGIDQRAAATVNWLVKHRRNLVQPDLVNSADPAPPTALLTAYSATAQMLAPLFDGNDELRGWISVHYVDGPRFLTSAEETALSTARSRIAQLLHLPEQ
jgi:hypothetical protein